MFIGIFMLPFYLKYLGAEAYGLVGFFTMLMSWMVLLDMGLTTTLQREIARLKDKVNGLLELKTLAASIEVFFLIVGIVLVFTIFLGSNWIATNWLDVKELSIDTVAICIKLMAFMIGFRWFVGLYSGAVMGFEDQVWLNKYKIIITSFKFIGSYLLIVYITDNIIHFFVYQLIIGITEYSIIKIKLNNYFYKVENAKLSFSALKEVAPFALGIAYTSGIWVFVMQLDKLMLSHYLSLKEYGYFSLVVVISNAILQLFQPIGNAILPRMASLLSNDKDSEMIALYHKSTQLVAIIIFSTSGMVAFFSYDLIYSWSGSVEAAKWAAPILFWYALGNAAVALLSFQYYMQYAHGNLKYHIRGNTVFGFFQIALIVYAVHFYGAVGAGITWFGLQTFFLLFWPGYIHGKFAPGIHKDWIVKDILPILLTSILYIGITKYFVHINEMNRILLFIMLVSLGIIMFIVNTIGSNIGREYFLKIIKKVKI